MTEDLTRRVTALETRAAVDNVNWLNINQKMDKIEDGVKWLTRLIGSALVLALIAFALEGGLAL